MENAKKVRVLTIRYSADIKQNEVPLFRGAVIAAMGGEADLLFHNHIDDEKFRYSYPFIQYKRIGGKAAIVAVEDGADIIGQFLTADCQELHLKDKHLALEIDSITPRQVLVQTWNSKFHYNISKWLPLNADNYRKYKQSDSLVERTELLERILIGNLISFAKGIGIDMSEQIQVKIKNINRIQTFENKEVKLMGFNLDFSCNMSIPDNIGLGKNASLGFGIVTKKKEKGNINQQ